MLVAKRTVVLEIFSHFSARMKLYFQIAHYQVYNSSFNGKIIPSVLGIREANTILTPF